jgi:hypothetical protein
MANFDKALHKLQKRIEDSLTESMKYEKKGNTAKAIEIREAAAAKFAGMGMQDRATEQYEKVYHLSKAFAERLDMDGNNAASLWYKKAAEALQKLPDTRTEGIGDLRSKADQKFSKYAEMTNIKGGFGHLLIVDSTLRAAGNVTDDAKLKKNIVGARIAHSVAHKENPTVRDKIFNAITLGIFSHQIHESSVHEALNMGLQLQTNLIDQQITLHGKAADRLIRKKDFLGGARELTVAADFCKNNHQFSKANSLTIMSAETFEKASDKAIKKRKIDVATNACRKAVIAFRETKNLDGENRVLGKLKTAYEREIADYSQKGLNGPAKTLGEQMAKLFAELGEHHKS